MAVTLRRLYNFRGSGKTLSSILECYVELSIAEGGPAIKPLGLFLQRSLSLCSVASISTLIFEAILVPLAFALPLEVRLLLVPISMGFHFGIGLTQSLVIGICFSPCLATYVFAFGANVEVLSTPWCVSVALYLLIQGYVFSRGNLLPEDWPITSVRQIPLFCHMLSYLLSVSSLSVELRTKCFLEPHICDRLDQASYRNRGPPSYKAAWSLYS